MKKTIVTAKELTTINRGMLQGLHNQFGYDFMNPYTLVKIEGAFTAKKALDGAINWELFEREDYKVVFLLSDRRCACYVANELKAAIYTRDVFDVKCVKSDFYHGLDNFYAKCDLENVRKDENTVTYVLIQKTRYIKTVNFRAAVPEIVTGKRYHYTEETARNFEKYSFADVIGSDSKAYTLKNGTGVKHDISHFIDKSGYYVYGYKNALEWRVYNLKTERARRHYAAADNTALIESLRAKIKATKAAAVIAFERANTAADLKRFEMALTYYNGFTCCVNDFEDLEKKESVKWYSSQNIFCAVYNRIWADLEKINF